MFVQKDVNMTSFLKPPTTLLKTSDPGFEYFDLTPAAEQNTIKVNMDFGKIWASDWAQFDTFTPQQRMW